MQYVIGYLRIGPNCSHA